MELTHPSKFFDVHCNLFIYFSHKGIVVLAKEERKTFLSQFLSYFQQPRWVFMDCEIHIENQRSYRQLERQEKKLLSTCQIFSDELLPHLVCAYLPKRAGHNVTNVGQAE